MSLRAFKSARAGLETTRGTAVTPTRLVYLTDGTHNQEVATIRPEELRNSYFGFYRAAAGNETNSLDFADYMTYTDLIWYSNVHIKAVASGTGAGADKTWTFTPSAATDDLKSATIQFGYSDGIGATQPAVELRYCLGEEFTLSFDKSSEGLNTISSRLITPKAATQISAFTGVLSDRTRELATAAQTRVYIDASTIGTTSDNDVTSVSWTLTNGFVNLQTLNNTSAAQDTFRPNPRRWTATITRYYRNDTEWDAYVNKTVRKIRVRALGPTLGASNYKVDLDLYGVYTARTETEVDGLGMEQFTLEPVYDTTATTDFSLVVVNADATIT